MFCVQEKLHVFFANITIGLKPVSRLIRCCEALSERVKICSTSAQKPNFDTLLIPLRVPGILVGHPAVGEGPLDLLVIEGNFFNGLTFLVGAGFDPGDHYIF